MACIEGKGRHDRCTVAQAVINSKHDDFPNVSVVKVGRGGSLLSLWREGREENLDKLSSGSMVWQE